MTKHGTCSKLAFRMMAVEFAIRDLIFPPGKILREAGLRQGMSVLDFGCGPGGFSIATSPLVGPRGRVIAMDIHPLALEMVQRRAGKTRCVNVEVMHGDRLKQLPDKCVDMVLLFDVLHDILEDAHILCELSRLLLTDGMVVVRDHHLRESEILAAMTSSGRFCLADRIKKTYRFIKSTGEQQ